MAGAAGRSTVVAFVTAHTPIHGLRRHCLISSQDPAHHGESGRAAQPTLDAAHSARKWCEVKQTGHQSEVALQQRAKGRLVAFIALRLQTSLPPGATHFSPSLASSLFHLAREIVSPLLSAHHNSLSKSQPRTGTGHPNGEGKRWSSVVVCMRPAE